MKGVKLFSLVIFMFLLVDGMVMMGIGLCFHHESMNPFLLMNVFQSMREAWVTCILVFWLFTLLQLGCFHGSMQTCGSRFRMFSFRMVFIFYGVVLFPIFNEARIILFFLLSFYSLSRANAWVHRLLFVFLFFFPFYGRCGCRAGFVHCINYIFLVFQVCMLVDAWVGATSYSFPSFYFWCRNCLSHLP